MSTMLPTSGDDSLADVDIVEQRGPSKTYNLRYDKESQLEGYCYELAAMEQAIYKILNTERYEYIIYSWNYGIELADLFGKPIPYVYAELQRRIQEALLMDDRITKVYNFDFSNDKRGEVLTKFSVDTIYGTLELEKEVSV